MTENARVLAAADALRRDDPVTLGALFLESHASMRDDFEISTPEIDRLVEIAAGDANVFGARMTGGGFGGAVIILCAEGFVRSVTDRNRCEVPRGHCMPGNNASAVSRIPGTKVEHVTSARRHTFERTLPHNETVAI